MATRSATLSRWERIRNLVVVVALALGFALTLAIFAEGNYGRPSCSAYGAARQLTYVALEYPSSPIGMPGRRPANCLFVRDSDQLVTVPFAEVAGNAAMAILVDLATTPLLTTPLFLVLFVFGLRKVYEAMGMDPRIRSSS